MEINNIINNTSDLLNPLGLIEPNGNYLQLYKYRNFLPAKKGKDHLSLLASSKDEAKTGVWFATPRSFNDPFDCQNPAEYFSDNELRNAKLITFIARKNGRDERDVGKEYDLRTKEGRWEANYNVQRHINDDLINILSLSKKINSTPMWSHYASNHTGFVIGYNLENLFNFIEENFKSGVDKSLFDLKKVKYCLVTPTSDDPFSYKSFLPIISVKHEDWKYEEEYRIVLMRPDDAGGCGIKKEMPSSVVESITFGLETCQNDEARLRESISHWPEQPKFYKMKRQPYSFELEIEPALKA